MKKLTILLSCGIIFFLSCSKKPTTPVVSTEPVTNISSTSATAGGTVLSDGSSQVTSRGICWATSANPTISNLKAINGSGSGKFTSELSNLVPGTNYHLRAFATNKMGTAYGADIPFTTGDNSGTDGGSSKTIIEGQTYTDNNTATWYGVTIARSKPVNLIFRNNSITSVNSVGYLLQAGDEGPANSNNNLDGELISGNKLVWKGVDVSSSITHGIFTGYNINTTIEYNFLYRVPTSMVLKSNGMTNKSGGVFYNIISKPTIIGITVKGINGVRIYNNTFYSDQVKYTDKSKPGTAFALVDVFANDGLADRPHSKGTQIKNNIFYTVNQIYNISIQNKQELEGFESDYNIFWCEKGTPVFQYLGTQKTFSEWQALGFDTHSVVMDPKFKDLNDFVPDVRLDYGTDLGSEFLKGLSTTATWIVGSAPATNDQNGHWQVGARIW